MSWQPDLYSDAYLEEPAPTLARLRTEDPVHRSRHGYWFLTRYRDVKASMRDVRFSSDWSERPAARSSAKQGPPAAPYRETDRDRANRALILSSFNMRDGEEHARVRSLVNQAFSKASLESQRERIESLAGSLLPPVGRGAEFDLVRDFGFPLPILISSEMIGIPADIRERFRTSFEETGPLGTPGHSAPQHARALEALEWQVETVRGLVEERRQSPRADLLSELVAAEDEGQQLTSDETISAIITIFTAAGTTTERFISSGMLLLLQHPEQLARLRGDRALMTSALEEILRFHHPDQSTTTPRWVTEDLELGGKLLARGDGVRFGIGAANRDPEEFPEPEKFDIARTPNRHLSFGRGRHFCLGATLARLVGEVAFTALLDRYPDIELATARPRRDPRRMDRFEEIRVRV